MVETWIQRERKIALALAAPFVLLTLAVFILRLPYTEVGLSVDKRSAKPLIEALERYRTQHSSYPERVQEIVPFLPGKAYAQEDCIGGWNYSRDGAGYSLVRQTDHDFGLLYTHSTAGAEGASGGGGEWRTLP